MHPLLFQRVRERLLASAASTISGALVSAAGFAAARESLVTVAIEDAVDGPAVVSDLCQGNGRLFLCGDRRQIRFERNHRGEVTALGLRQN